MAQNNHPALVLGQVFQEIPKATKFFLVLNVVLYVVEFVYLWNAFLSFTLVYTHNQWYRLLLAPVHHLDRKHLVFNMLTFLFMGPKLERHMGGGWFFYLLCVFALLSGLVYVLLQALLALANFQSAYGSVVGFSGVLFGLSVVKNHLDPDGVTYLWTVPVPNRQAVVVELLFLYATNPRSSFIGHFAGILVGLLYTKGPLETIMKKCAGLGSSIGDFIRWLDYLIDRVRGIRHWAREEVRIDELRNNRLKRFKENPK